MNCATCENRVECIADRTIIHIIVHKDRWGTYTYSTLNTKHTDNSEYVLAMDQICKKEAK